MTGSSDAMPDLFGTTIDVYTRAQAIADGTLVEVPADMSRQAGSRAPVALTSAVWQNCVRWDDADAERTGAYQDQNGRLWDVLWMGWLAARRARPTDSTPIPFKLYRIARDAEPGPDGVEPTLVYLFIALGADFDGSACVTIMEPGED